MLMIQSQEQPVNGQYNNIYRIQVYLSDFSQNSGYVYDRRRVVLYNCCDSWTFFVADLGLVEISLDDQTSIEWQINQLYARPKFNQENIHLVASYGVVAHSQCETLKAEYNWT